jgi:hypothetical protein
MKRVKKGLNRSKHFLSNFVREVSFPFSFAQKHDYEIKFKIFHDRYTVYFENLPPPPPQLLPYIADYWPASILGKIYHFLKSLQAAQI